MKRFYLFIPFISIFLFVNASGDSEYRLDLDPRLEPFYHGVASGDPLKDAVIIWTRVTTESPSTDVEWEMSSDLNFSSGSIVASGTYTTTTERDHTVKIDVTGLNSNAYYFYRFKALGNYSLVGRTKTAPASAESDQLRFATVSCSSFQHGYFNVYNRIKDRNDIDAVIHLGDYVYEYGPGEYGELRDHDPPQEMVELVDYRTRYSQYRLDPALRDLHQQYPFITTWDDHESADNSWSGGAVNHQPDTEGDWFERLSASAKAYSEWLPIRNPDITDDTKIYRKFNYGDLADIFVLDTRITGRDEQLGFGEPANDPTRTLLGAEQLEWLKDGLLESDAQWKIIAQQIMVGPFTIFGIALNNDQWEGYKYERTQLFKYFMDLNEIDNVVILTGDIHTSWAMDLPLGFQPYFPSTGENSVGVEFVTTSVTSPGFPIGFVTQIIKDNNKHMKYIDLTEHGFGLLDITSEKTQNDFYYVRTIEELDDRVNFRVGWYTEDGENHLVKNTESTESIYPDPEQAPGLEDTMVTAVEINNISITGLYPNPVVGNEIQVQFFVQESDEFTISLYDMAGSLIVSKNLGTRNRGVNLHTFELPTISSGTYNLVFEHGGKSSGQSFIKFE